jgi:hypothetical protein
MVTTTEGRLRSVFLKTGKSDQKGANQWQNSLKPSLWMKNPLFSVRKGVNWKPRLVPSDRKGLKLEPRLPPSDRKKLELDPRRSISEWIAVSMKALSVECHRRLCYQRTRELFWPLRAHVVSCVQPVWVRLSR